MHRETLPVRQGPWPRWLSAVLLVAVFFLPLHFHASTAITSQISKECVCLQGARLHLDVHAPTPIIAPAPPALLFSVLYLPVRTDRWADLPSVRGPPSTASV